MNCRKHNGKTAGSREGWQTGLGEWTCRALCDLDVEGTGFSQETDLNKEKPWDGVFKLRGGKTEC